MGYILCNTIIYNDYLIIIFNFPLSPSGGGRMFLRYNPKFFLVKENEVQLKSDQGRMFRFCRRRISVFCASLSIGGGLIIYNPVCKHKEFLIEWTVITHWYPSVILVERNDNIQTIIIYNDLKYNEEKPKIYVYKVDWLK